MWDKDLVKQERDGIPAGFALLWLAIALAWAVWQG